MRSFISVKDEYKRYKMGEVEIVANDGVSFEVEEGEFAIIVGQSGAGKSTVLNLLGGMDTCDEGDVWVGEEHISTFSPRQLTTYRRYSIGFVFQFYNLIQNLTAKENVELAAQICKDPMDPAEALRQVGLGDRINNFPSQLSGGEQQRVSIARALAKRPDLLLCDEPTGALDDETGKLVLSLLQDVCHTNKTTVIVVTHNQAICPMADRVIRMRNGKVVEMTKNPDPTPVERIEW